MAQEDPNPLMNHVMGVLEGRQQTEIAKLTLLTQLLEEAKAIREQLNTIRTELDQIQERVKP